MWVDAAQALGHVGTACGADAIYATSRKWLCGPRGIGVTVVAPGILQGESTDYVPAERHRLYEDGRAVPGPQTPEDIVDTVVFLLTSGALALTGQVLPVNAGFVFT